MAVALKPETKQLSAHRLAMIKIMEEVDAQAGVVSNPTMTAEELQARQRAHGVHAEDNIGSREILRMRYGDDYEQE